MVGRFISDLHHLAYLTRDFRQSDPAALLRSDFGSDR